MQAKGLSPWTVNGIRGVLHTVFRRAPKDMWNGPNPLQDVEKTPTLRKIRATLRAEVVSVHGERVSSEALASGVPTATSRRHPSGSAPRRIALPGGGAA